MLDHLTSLDIPAIFAANLAPEEREKSIKITKQKLRLLKKEIKEEIEVINSKWDGRNSFQALQKRLHLAPYKLIENLVLQVEIALNEHEIKGTTDWQLEYGTIIVGNLEKEEWHIFNPKEATIWYAQNAQSQIKDLQSQIEQDKQMITSLNSEIRATMQRQKMYGIVFILVATVFLLSGFWFVSADSVIFGLLVILFAFFLYLWALGSLIASGKPDRKLLERLNGVKEHIAKCDALIEQWRKKLTEVKGVYEDLKRQASS